MRYVIMTLLVGTLAPLVIGDDLQFGVNGHPFVQEAYRSIPVEIQLDRVKKLGVRWYRSDWGDWAVKQDGLTKLKRLLSEAKKREIKILPIIFPPVNLHNESDEETIYHKSFEYAKTLVNNLKGYIKYWELHNELDNFAMIHKGERMITGVIWQWGDPDGDRREHYEEGRYRRARAVLHGLSDGVHAADETAMRIINTGGWLHYGFVQRLIDDGVPFDILAWHWYSDMGDITRVRGRFNLLERLCGFGKPLWITECNRRNGSLGKNGDLEQEDYLKKTLTQFHNLAKQYPVHSVFIYELLDEPYFGAQNPESHYGLIRVSRDTNGKWILGEPKRAFYAIQKITSKAPRAQDQ